MPDVFTMDASELVDFGRDLRRRGPALVRKHVQGTLEAAGRRIAAESRRRVPVVTGALQGSISVSHEGSLVEVGASMPYAVAVEFGGRRKSSSIFTSKGRTGYLLPSFFDDIPQFDRDLEKSASAANEELGRL